MHQRTKFHKDRSNRCGDIAIFVIFKMAAAAILDFQKFKILTEGRLCIKIGQTVADIWPFNGFFKMAAVRHLDDYWRPLFRNPSKGRVNLDIAVRAQPMQGQG